MKFVPVNSENVCKQVSAPEMDILNTCFNFQTIYQECGLQYVLVTNPVVTF